MVPMSAGFSLAAIARATGGTLENAPVSAEIVCAPGAIAIDSRACEPGQLFVAIRGERDGHDFVAAAAARGAIGALVMVGARVESPPAFPLIRVDDPLKALQRWAASHRAGIPACVIAVTGSSGKTTTKDRLAAILSTMGPTHSTPGNLNNHLGVPITLLGLRPEHQWAVVEIAMNHPGEIAPLSRLARPHHAVITTIGWAHIGAFGSREGILREKLGILAGLEPGGILFHDADPWIDEHLPQEVRKMRQRTFGLSPGADMHPDTVDWDVTETRFASAFTGEVRYRCPGRGPLMAALAASLVAKSVGVPGESVRRSLEEARPRPLRMEPRPLGPATALLDCYNASPESSLAAIEFLLSIPRTGRRWLAFGEMRELGEQSAEAHARVGERAAALDGAFFLGDGCAPALDAYRRVVPDRPAAAIYRSIDDLAKDLCAVLGEGDVVLFKGARLMAMERVFEACLQNLRTRRGE
jgi:UDP-N-acetylmuramoyl-tripeptide--D-alanyl-D-alanine ligase